MAHKKQPCAYCGIKPYFDDDGSYCFFNSVEIIAEGGVASVCIGAKPKGKIFMVAWGQGYSKYYYPKFCPECGRRLNGSRKHFNKI